MKTFATALALPEQPQLEFIHYVEALGEEAPQLELGQGCQINDMNRFQHG